MSSVFISYSHTDKPFAKRLAADLRDAGHTVWIDEAQILVGDSLVEKIRDAIDNVDFIAAVVSSASIHSQWVKKELDLASNREIDEKRVVVLPILLDDVELPGFLKGKCYANFIEEENYQDGLNTLLKRLGPETPPPDLSSDKLMIKPYLRIATPAHSWLRVPLSELEQLGIRDDISGYSYQDNLYAYLEEDDDEMTFAQAKEKQHSADYDLEEDTFTVFVGDFVLHKPTNEVLPCKQCHTAIQFEMPAGTGQTVKVTCPKCGVQLNAHRRSDRVFFGPPPSEHVYACNFDDMKLPHVQVRRKILSLIYDKWASGELSVVADTTHTVKELSDESMPRDAQWPLVFALNNKIYGPFYQPDSKELQRNSQIARFDRVHKDAWLRKAEAAWLAQVVYRIMRYNPRLGTKYFARQFFKNPKGSDVEIVKTAMKYAMLDMREREKGPDEEASDKKPDSEPEDERAQHNQTEI